MANKEFSYEGLGVFGPILWACSVFGRFTVLFSSSLWKMTVTAAHKVGEIQVERQANRVLQEQQAEAMRAAETAASAQQAQAAAAAAASPARAAAGPAPAAAPAAARATADTIKPAKATDDEPLEAPVSWPTAAATAPAGTTRSGKQGAELEVADRHLVKTMGGKTIKLSLYRKAGKVERYDVKAKTRLAPYLASMAAEEGVELSLEAAQHFTEREIIAARTQKRNGKAQGAAQASAGHAVNQKSATPAAGSPEAQMPNLGDEPPPHMEIPPGYDMSYGGDYEAPRASAKRQPSKVDDVEPGFIGDSMMVDGETEYEATVYTGIIVKMGKAMRRPKGEKAFETYEMEMTLDDGTTKVFTGVELKKKKLQLGLDDGDRISVQQGTSQFEVVMEGGKRQPRTKNVFSIRVESRKNARMSAYGRRAQA